MKNIFNILTALFIALFAISCRNSNDIPEDIHEHEEIEKLVVKIVNKSDANDVQYINYIGGKYDKPAQVKEGENYLVSLDFQVKHDDHYHSVNDEIITEKEEHFITYALANANIIITRSNDDIRRANGKKIGMKTEWKVNSIANDAVINIKLMHGATTVDDNFPTDQNQLGKTTGGESDLDVMISVQKK